MAKIIVIGAGFAGHIAALYLGDDLGKSHEITVINKYDYFGYVPSWVWVGVGTMKPEKTVFDLAPVYAKKNVRFVHGAATEVHPDEQYVMAAPDGGEESVRLDYDYLVIATGPRLDFAATPGLGPHGGHTYSICTLDHATQARDAYLETVAKMEAGEHQRIVVGTGHGMATCQGAAFEYITNIHKDLIRRGVRDKADLLWLSNERAAGDFGVRGIHMKQGDRIVGSDEFIKALFDDYGIRCELQRGVNQVDEEVIHWEDFEGSHGTTRYDFAMLVPRFLGVSLKFIDESGSDISDTMTNPGGFILVDAQYGLSWDELKDKPDAWPARYQNPTYPNIFAAGIAFAPPGSISQPHTTPNGTTITATAPRTGMISGIIGRLVARNLVDLVKSGRMPHEERMSHMAAACIASMGDSLWDGSAATIIMYPVVPDPHRYPNEYGRDLFVTEMEVGLAGAWMKRMIQSTFIYKLKGRPGWKIIPE
ncbi:MAG: FAD-dependent oxidoreductase [Actinomycetota bacterium]